MEGKVRASIKPIGTYCAWGAFLGVLSNIVQRGLLRDDWRLTVMLGAAIGGALIGAAIWWWRARSNSGG
jgi:hypothetical protein